MPSDFELLDRWRAGDAQAGEDLFERYFEPVCRFFYNKVDDNVEDLVQQTFLGCVESRDRFRKEAAFFTFLIAVAKNVLRKHYWRRHRDDRIDFGTASVNDLGPSPSLVVAERDDQRTLLEALRRVPIDLQIALELHYWEEMSASEIAVALEIPEGTAKSRLRRGKEVLRACFDELRAAGAELADEAALDRCASSLKQLLPHPEPRTHGDGEP